jgi:hypothetical protein
VRQNSHAVATAQAASSHRPAGGEIDQHVIARNGADRIGKDTERTRHRLHPRVAARAGDALGRHVGDDRARGVEAHVDREIQRQRDGNRDPQDGVDAQLPRNDADRRQRQDHERREDAADDDERPAAPAPEPDAIADHPDQQLTQDSGEWPGGPDKTDFMDIESVLGAEDPAQHRNLHRQRETHGRRRQREHDQEWRRQPALHGQHE